MSKFLQQILKTKDKEVQILRENKILQNQQCRNEPARFREKIASDDCLAMITEVKKASPSKGLIQPDFRPVEIARLYQNLGAAAISVLTDKDYFQGSIEHLKSVGNSVNLPVLRKDFIIDIVQINEAVLAGAHAILLICAALSENRLKELSQYAQDCGLDVLVEIHNMRELEPALAANPSVLGINNRDLATFNVNLATTEEIMFRLSVKIPVIAESGISSSEDAKRMRDAGVSGLLVGESLMRRIDSAVELQRLFESLRLPKQPHLLKS